MTTVVKDYFRELTQSSISSSLSDQCDRTLVQRLLVRQDEAAFLAIVNRHGGMVYRVCLRMLNRPQDAEDAFQATFLILAQNLAAIRNTASLASWLHGVARRVSLRTIEQSASRQRRERQAARADLSADQEESLPELQAELDRELERLPQSLRQPLILCCLEGHTLEGAAGQLGWSLSTLRRRLDKAKELLSRRLIERGLMAGGTLAALFVQQNSTLAAPPASLVAATVQTGLPSLPAPVLIAGMACQPFAALASSSLPSLALAKIQSACAIGMLLLLLGLGGAALAEAMANARPDQDPPLASRSDREDPQAKENSTAANALNNHEQSTWGAFHAAAISQNGKLIAAGSDKGQVALWDSTTGKLVQELKTDQPVQSIVFLGNDKSLALGTYQGGIEIWTKQTAGYVRSRGLGNKDEMVYGLALSANGQVLAASGASGWTYLYETSFWKPIGVIFERSNLTSGVAFSQSGAMLATAGNTFSAWDLTKDSPLWKARGEREIGEIESATKRGLLWQTNSNAQPGDEVYCADIAISPDGSRVVGVNGTSRLHGGGKCLYCWDARTGKLIFKSLAEGMTCVIFVDDGKRIVTGSTDGTVRLWDAQNGRLLKESKEHQKAVRSLVSTPFGGFASAARTGPSQTQLLREGMPQVANFLSASEDGTVLVWDATTLKPLQRFLGRK